MHTLATVTRLFPQRPLAEGAWPSMQERAEAWRERRDELMRGALKGERLAFSYRSRPPFGNYNKKEKRYGAALLVCRPAEHPEDRFGVFWGYNCTVKPRPKDAVYEKPCAEWNAWEAAFNSGFPRMRAAIHGLVVYSDNVQADDVSGVLCNVQHPCWECRCRLQSLLLPNAPLILFRRRLPCDVMIPEHEEFVVEETTFGRSLQLHQHQSRQR